MIAQKPEHHQGWTPRRFASVFCVDDVVRDGGRITRIVFRNAGLNLADQIATDVSALGEDTAAKTGKNRDQRGAETERDNGVDDRAVIGAPCAASR